MAEERAQEDLKKSKTLNLLKKKETANFHKRI